MLQFFVTTVFQDIAWINFFAKKIAKDIMVDKNFDEKNVKGIYLNSYIYFKEHSRYQDLTLECERWFLFSSEHLDK